MFPCSKLDLAVCAGASWGLEPARLPPSKTKGGRGKNLLRIVVGTSYIHKRGLRRTAKAKWTKRQSGTNVPFVFLEGLLRAVNQ